MQLPLETKESPGFTRYMLLDIMLFLRFELHNTMFFEPLKRKQNPGFMDRTGSQCHAGRLSQPVNGTCSFHFFAPEKDEVFTFLL